MKTRRFVNQYSEDGKELRLKVREAAGHRCIRCIRCDHPFESGKHGRGEWSPCDERCSHKGPIGMQMDDGVLTITSDSTAGIIASQGVRVVAQWRILTVHHLDGDKANDQWWNTLALCQRCHLKIQTRVDPQTPYFLEHSPWFKPYAAGFYAQKYENRSITREEAEDRMEELLAYENRVDATLRGA